MKSLLLLKHLRVENANAIAGFTYGFPAITHFLGFTHALSRTLEREQQVKLGGCAVVCHDHHVNAYQPAGWGDYVFSLSRNPLSKEAKPAAFVEEARMHMTVSLLIECPFTLDDVDFSTGDDELDQQQLEALIKQQISKQRLAAGTIIDIGHVQFVELAEDSQQAHRQQRRLLWSLLPGFVLVDRRDLLAEHYQQCLEKDPSAQLLDAWLDFSAMRYCAEKNDRDSTNEEPPNSAQWQRIDKPAGGWLVPITTGFKAISPLYEAGTVKRTRDPELPFQFVEAVYSVGEWVGAHRIDQWQQALWHYHWQDDWYLCQNQYCNEHRDLDTQPA